ncbi:HAMP domain-containing histidine kinase [Fulvivirga maritima]|uniref:sensor histidine kinase n=1 Tax=Fulvivirga maritima TaxID=2904247 RepID=UPI001F1A2BB7|nr:HAMP domain-containing sensor histidine kinase [Fulvivirga maritima]UII27011.1 HAMP domain-containing histidine kinase [Fulvivirga maritima]
MKLGITLVSYPHEQDVMTTIVGNKRKVMSWPSIFTLQSTPVEGPATIIWFMLLIKVCYYKYIISQIKISFRDENEKLQLHITQLTTKTRYLKDLQKIRSESIKYLAHDLTGMLDGFSSITKASNIVIAPMLHMIQRIVWVQDESKDEVTPQSSWYKLPAIINETITLLNYKACNNNICIHSEIHDVFIYGDQHHIKRVCFNLINNALKFSPQGAYIKISSHQVSDTSIIIQFQDEGPGIEQEHLPHIFDLNYQAPSAPRGISKGIGLAYCKRVMEAHHSYITVESEVGIGTTFSIQLKTSPTVKNQRLMPVKVLSTSKKEMSSYYTDPKISAWAQKIRHLKVYQTSKVKRVLEEISEDNKQVMAWKEAVLKAISYCDHSAYEKLTQINDE